MRETPKFDGVDDVLTVAAASQLNLDSYSISCGYAHQIRLNRPCWINQMREQHQLSLAAEQQWATRFDTTPLAADTEKRTNAGATATQSMVARCGDV